MAKLTQAQIKKRADEVKQELRDFDKKTLIQRQKIINKLNNIQDECSHPNKIGRSEGYCPDCGQSFG